MGVRMEWAARGCAALLAFALVACGGGGGGETEDPPPSGGGGGDATPSGLLPASPALGPTLHSDATRLLPLRDGTVVRYRGVHVAAPSPRGYSNTVRWTAGADGYRGAASNAVDDGPDPGSLVLVQSGAIKVRESVSLEGTLPAETIDITLLRSPVRAGDRHVALDRRYASVGVDYDGDAVHDGLDVAVWSDVAGSDTVTLATGRRVTALRVDTKIRMRLRLSFDRITVPPTESVMSHWFADGLGIVKSRYQPPSIDGVADVVEETLETLDAGDSGIGHTEPALQFVPGSTTGVPAPGTTVFPDGHVVAITGLPGEPSSIGFSLARIDTRGRVVAVKPYRYADVAARGGMGRAPQLMQMGNELRVVFASDDGIQMLRLDATGQTLLAPRAVVLSTAPLHGSDDGVLFSAGVAGGQLWLSWMDYPVYVNDVYLSTLSAQSFDAAGVPTAPPGVLATGLRPLTVRGPHMAAASGNRLLLSWTVTLNDLVSGYYAVFGHAVTAPLAQGALAPVTDTSACRAGLQRPFGPTDGAPAFWCFGNGQWGSATLDAALAPVLSGGALRVDPLLPADIRGVPGTLTLTPAPGRLVLSGQQTGRLWPEDSADTIFWQIGDLPWRADGSADTAGYVTLARLYGQNFVPVTQVPLADRILVIGTDCECQGGLLSTMVVWR